MALLWVVAVASDYDEQKPLYHASEHEFAPGDVVKPASEVGKSNFNYGSGEDAWRAHRVWMSDDPWEASTYRPDAHVYEVRPSRNWVKHDAEMSDEGERDYHAGSARVVRRLHPEEAWPDDEDDD